MKRSAKEKILRYKRKLQKLEDKENRRQISESSSDDEIHQDVLPTEEQEVQIPTVDIEETPPQTTSHAEIDPEILSALGTSNLNTPDFGEPIHESLSVLWTPILKKGLLKDEKSKLMKDYLIPSNCKLLQAPKLNVEVAAAISEVVKNRDKKLDYFQQVLGAGTTAIYKAMDLLMKTDDKIESLKHLSNGCRLLSDLHHSFTSDRKKLLTPSLERSFIQVIQDTERDETLFGNELADKIKASKAIERQGHQIRKTTVTKATSSAPQAATSRPIHSGNWGCPPRFPSFRGGRGGQRRPAPAPRRSYQATTQASTRPFNQNKPRANMHQ